MATCWVSDRGVARAREPIDARRYVLDSDCGSAQPDAVAENACMCRTAEWRHKAGAHDLPQRLDGVRA